MPSRRRVARAVALPRPRMPGRRTVRSAVIAVRAGVGARVRSATARAGSRISAVGATTVVASVKAATATMESTATGVHATASAASVTAAMLR